MLEEFLRAVEMGPQYIIFFSDMFDGSHRLSGLYCLQGILSSTIWKSIITWEDIVLSYVGIRVWRRYRLDSDQRSDIPNKECNNKALNTEP